MRKFQLEMGGKNPLVVLDDADLKTAVECAVNGAYFSTGQRCTASSRLIVTDGVYTRFADALAERMKGLVIDDAAEAGRRTSARWLIRASSTRIFRTSRSARTRARSSQSAASGSTARRPASTWRPRCSSTPTIRCEFRARRSSDPVAAMIRARDYDEALELANDTEFGLCAGICTTSLKYASHFKRNAEVGMVMVNLPTAGVDYHVPFGGRKGSSLGAREQGSYAVEFYTTVKTAYVAA